MRFPSYTPWGSIQSFHELIPGLIILVHTAGHGGIGIDAEFAEDQLSDECLKIGEHNGDIYWFEEDCDMCAPILELLDSATYSDILFTCYKNNLTPENQEKMNKGCMRDICTRTLQRYRPEYMAFRTKKETS